MKKTLLFSDVHLKVAEAERPHREAFAAFLRRFSPDEFDRVICLGDLFDFWFEYRHVIFSKYFDILRVFADLRDAGVELHLVCGNHDFWAGRFLETEIGFQVHRDAVRLPFGGKSAYLVHGDGVNPRDWSYRAFKRVARNRLVVGGFRLLHPDAAMGLAQAVSRCSRALKLLKRPRVNPEAEALRAHARRLLADGTVDIVACGHAHAPECTPFPSPDGMGIYVNTGDWMRHRSHVVWDGEAFDLRYEPGFGPGP